jgi:hypothetical protein
MDFRARSAFGVKRVGLEAGHSRSSAIPSRRFTRPQGVDPLFTVPPCCRWLTLFGFSLQSFLPPGSSLALVAPACPPRRFSMRGTVPVAWSCCLVWLRPRGISESGKRYRTFGPVKARKVAHALLVVVAVFVVFPSLVGVPVSRGHPPVVFDSPPSKLADSWTFGVFEPAPWRSGP